LRGAKKRLGWLNQGEIEYIAKDLGVSARDVLEMDKRLNAHDVAESEILSPAGYLEDYRFEPAIIVEEKEFQEHKHGQLRKALGKLDARSQDILQQRWLTEEKTTLQQLAKRYKVSAERIRQIECNAIKKLKKSMTTLLA